MVQYVIRRLLFFVPTFLVIALLTFGLSRMAPGDPVVTLCGTEGALVAGAYEDCARQYHLDRPAFFFSVQPATYPDTLYRVFPSWRQEKFRRLLDQHGQWAALSRLDQMLGVVQAELDALPDSLGGANILQYKQIAKQARSAERLTTVNDKLVSLRVALTEANAYSGALLLQVDSAQQIAAQILVVDGKKQNLLPRWVWHGFDNQFFHWTSGLLSGNWGVSYMDRKPVGKKIWEGLFWTFLVSGLAFLWAFLIAVPLGLYAAWYRDSWLDRVSTVVLFFFFSMPRFWVATMLVVFFTTSEYGMRWFASVGLPRIPADAGIFEILLLAFPHLLLPIFSMGYLLLAFIFRQVRGAALEAIQSDYIRTAKAKGLSAQQILWRHLFPNTLLPLITILAGVLPGLIAGSIVVEFIFSIPGMGGLTYEAFYAADWPVVFAILLLGSLLTMLGILMADLLYAWADPRITLGKTHRE